MKLNNIKNYLKTLDVIPDENFIYAQIDAKFWKYTMFSGFAVLSIQHFLLYFEKNRILLIGVTKTANFSNKTSEVLRKDISSIVYKKGLLQGSILIQTNDEKVSFKVPKVIAIASWHKKYLERLIHMNFS